MCDEAEEIENEDEDKVACDHCGAMHDENDLAPAIGGRGREIQICSACQGGTYFPSQCAEGGEWLHYGQSAYLADTEEYVSRAYARDYCYYSEDSDSWYRDEDSLPESECNVLYDYSDRVDAIQPTTNAPTWVMDREGALVFGVESEMEADNSVSDLAEALGGRMGNGLYILKSDGSLDNGVELVTLPFTLQEHRDLFKWPEVLKNATRHGAGDRRTCGIHVHINRTAVTPLTLGKMLVFINSDLTRDLMETIAQRGATSYCARFKKKITDALKEPEVRYQAVNVTKRTIEIRIFKGNARPERVLKNIEFCHAMCMYLPDCGLAQVEDPARFIMWLRKRRKDYPELVKFLIEKGVM